MSLSVFLCLFIIVFLKSHHTSGHWRTPQLVPNCWGMPQLVTDLTLQYPFTNTSRTVLSSPWEAPYFYKCLWAFLKSLSVFLSLSEEEASGLSPLKWEASRSENPGPGSCSLTQRAQRTLSIYVFLWVRVCSNLEETMLLKHEQSTFLHQLAVLAY